MENLYSPLPLPPLSDGKLGAMEIKPEPLEFDGPLEFSSFDWGVNVKSEEKPIILKEEESSERLSYRFAYRFTDHYDSLTKKDADSGTCSHPTFSPFDFKVFPLQRAI
jgi:hypothetical protein